MCGGASDTDAMATSHVRRTTMSASRRPGVPQRRNADRRAEWPRRLSPRIASACAGRARRSACCDGTPFVLRFRPQNNRCSVFHLPMFRRMIPFMQPPDPFVLPKHPSERSVARRGRRRCGAVVAPASLAASGRAGSRGPPRHRRSHTVCYPLYLHTDISHRTSRTGGHRYTTPR